MARKLNLTLACGDYEITRPLIDGTVQPDGIELTMLTALSSRDRHWRLARHNDYDMCEYNACAYLMARDRNLPLTALPVFLHRRFRHGFVFVNTAKGIRTPRDLMGRRVGGVNFVAAGNIWVRGILEEVYDVPHRSMTYVTERPEDFDFTPHDGLTIERIRNGKPLDDMLADGELDAMISPEFPRPFLDGDSRIARLLPDFKDIEIAYYRETGIFPIMHLTTIRQEIVEEHPWVVTSMMRAFEQAKALAYRRVRNPRVVPLAFFRSAWEEQEQLLGPDPWAYGLGAANRKNLEAAIRYTHMQGLIRRLMNVDELFADADLD